MSTNGALGPEAWKCPWFRIRPGRRYVQYARQPSRRRFDVERHMASLFSTFWRQRISFIVTADIAAFVNQHLQRDTVAQQDGPYITRASPYPHFYNNGPKQNRRPTNYRLLAFVDMCAVGFAGSFRTCRAIQGGFLLLAMLVSYLVNDTWSLPSLSRSTGMGS